MSDKININKFNAYVYKNKKDIINQFYEILEKEAEKLKKEIIDNKNWLENKQPIMQEFFNKFQYFLQEDNLQYFGNLMTILSNEIIYNPNGDKNEETLEDIGHKIVFELFVRNNMPALKINAENKDKNKEKITSGGLKNIIATGLRILALCRLTEGNNTNKGDFTYRKFLILDEPDCWIAEESMPNYAKLLHQLTKYFKLQVVMVTHKNPEYFKPYARLYEIQKDDFVTLNLISDIKNDEENDEYIKSIHLKNFKSHKDTLIEFNSSLNIIVGGSHTGKSVIMEAFNAIINNESDDDVIRHNENVASIVLDIKNKKDNNIILWERIKKKTNDFPQKVRYRLYKKEDNKELTLLNEEYNSYSTPDSIVNSLQMKKIDNIDINLGHQEDMNFLLSNAITDQTRASILSLGKESSYVNRILENLRTKTKDSKSLVKINEKKYNDIAIKIANHSIIDKDDSIFKKLLKTEEIIKNNELKSNKIDNTYLKLNKYDEISNINIKHENIFNNNFLNLKSLDNIIYKMKNYNNIANIDLKINSKFRFKEIINLENINYILSKEYLFNIANIKILHDKKTYKYSDLTELDKIINKIEINSKLGNVLITNQEKRTFEINKLKDVDILGKKINQSIIELNNLEEELKEKIKESKLIKNEIIKFEKEIKICPLCSSNLVHKHE